MIRDFNTRGINIRYLNARVIYRHADITPAPTDHWFQFDVTPLDSTYKLKN